MKIFVEAAKLEQQNRPLPWHKLLKVEVLRRAILAKC